VTLQPESSQRPLTALAYRLKVFGQAERQRFGIAIFNWEVFAMSILVVIACWTLGSIVFGLILARIFGVAARRRSAEEQSIASQQTENCETAHTCVNSFQNP